MNPKFALVVPLLQGTISRSARRHAKLLVPISVITASSFAGFLTLARCYRVAAQAPSIAMDSAPRGVLISKTMSYVLRHSATKLGISIRSDGFCLAAELLTLPDFQRLNCNLSDLRQAVASSNKKRFELLEENGQVFIRAVQGHSMKEVEDEHLLRSLHYGDAAVPSICVHGTYKRYLDSILSKGLLPGGNITERKHVHFAPYEPGDGKVISGMRYDCEVAIYLDLNAALREGVPFFISSNQVILSPGIQGVVPARFISKVKVLESGKWVPRT